MKRVALLCGLVAVVLSTSPHARATDGWAAAPADESRSSNSVTIVFETTEPNVTMGQASLKFVGQPPEFDGCTNPNNQALRDSVEKRTEPGGSGYFVVGRYDFETPACNGVYAVELYAYAHRTYHCGPLNNQPCPPFEGAASTTIPIERKPDPPTDVQTQTNSDRSVTVTWTSPYSGETPAPPDFLGFAVQRVDASGTAELLASDQPDSEFKDSKVPAAGGTFTYEVFSLRPDAGTDYVESDAVSSEKVTVAAAPPDSTSSIPPTTAGGGGAGGGGGSGAGVTSGGTSRGSRTTPFGAPRTTTTMPPDEGYESSLPYQSEPGDEEAQAPLDILDEDSGTGGTGLVRPIAVSLVLSIWAMHILYVTRSAQRANALVPALVIEPVTATAEPPPPPPPAPAWLGPDDEDPMTWWAAEQARSEV